MKLCVKFLLLLLSLEAIVLLGRQKSTVFAQDDEEVVDAGDVPSAGDSSEDGDDEAAVDSEEDPVGTAAADVPPDDVAAEEEGEADETIKASPDADTALIFPDYSGKELPAGKMIRCLVGLTNVGEMDFIVDSIDASFRYPQDYSYIIQNFTAYPYNTVVQPSTQQSLEYVFFPHEYFSGRPFGLTINLHYRDSNGTLFRDAVFNETINMYEIEEGFDGETFFMYILLISLIVLVIALAYYYSMSRPGSKRRGASQPIEMGTQRDDGVDMDWIPKETIAVHDSSSSPRRSPRQRKSKAST